MKRFGLGLVTLSVFAIGGPHYSDSYYLTDEFEVSESVDCDWTYTESQNQQPCTWLSWAATCFCSGIFLVWSWCHTDSQSRFLSLSVTVLAPIYIFFEMENSCCKSNNRILTAVEEEVKMSSHKEWHFLKMSHCYGYWYIPTLSCINLICLAYQMSVNTFQQSFKQWAKTVACNAYRLS